MTIDTPLLRHLVRIGKAGQLVAIGTSDGFMLAVREDNKDLYLEAQRGHKRKFKRLQSVAAYLKDIGVVEFKVELKEWGLDTQRQSMLLVNTESPLIS